MTRYAATVGRTRFTFADLKEVMAKASPLRSGDALAGALQRYKNLKPVSLAAWRLGKLEVKS